MGRGHHEKYGGRHAEAVAIASASRDVRGSTLFVNLEPCSHQGNQPPCAEKIIAAGIKRVVIGTVDPNPLVNGRGIALLEEDGVEVVCGVLEHLCREANAAFFKYMETGVPLVTIKTAQTLDGRIAAADGSSKWISSDKARQLVHRMRAGNDAVLVGAGTVAADDPQLNVRLVPGRDPMRIVLDSQLRLPERAKVLADGNQDKTIIACTAAAPAERMRRVAATGVAVWTLPADPSGRVDLPALLKRMAESKLISLLVEGGAAVISAFLRLRLADRVAVFVSPKVLGSGLNAFQDFGVAALADALLITDVRNKKVGSDILITGRISQRE